MQVDGRLIAIAQPIAVERGQLQHDADARLRLGHRAELAFAQLGELRVVLAGEIELDQLFGGGPAGRLEQR